LRTFNLSFLKLHEYGCKDYEQRRDTELFNAISKVDKHITSYALKQVKEILGGQEKRK
jgi:hypothetical protein